MCQVLVFAWGVSAVLQTTSLQRNSACPRNLAVGYTRIMRFPNDLMRINTLRPRMGQARGFLTIDTFSQTISTIITH
jgi:hypothetical protein